MPRSRKSQRKLARRDNWFDFDRPSSNETRYSGYFGDMLYLLDKDFQNNQQRVKHWIGRTLAESFEEWYRAPRAPMSASDIFNVIQFYENRHYSQIGTVPTLLITDSDRAAFEEVSRRLSFSYVAYATYYLRKAQLESLERGGSRYHSSHHAPIYLTYDAYPMHV